MQQKKLLISAVIFLFCFACNNKNNELHIYNWTYYIPDSILNEFKAETGIDLVYDVYTTNEEMYAKLKAGKHSYDVIFPSGDYVSILMRQNMLMRLEHTELTNLKQVNPAIRSKLIHDPGMVYSIPFVIGASMIAVNIRLLPEYESSWTLFNKKELMQHTTLLDDMREVFGAALKTLGYSVNSTNNHELTEAKNLITTWKLNIVKFDNHAFSKSFASGALFAVHCYPENVVQEYDVRRLESDVAFVIPREGGPMYVDSICIPASSKNADKAHRFIDVLLRPNIYAKISDRLQVPGLNLGAEKLIKKKPVYNLESLSNHEFIMDLGAAIIKYNHIWQEIINTK
jgi:spermidine/putrescine transport system substrate-binding protein